MPAVRNAVLDDLPALTDLYNYYVAHTPITFDVVMQRPEQRRAWFDDHQDAARHRLLVAEEHGRIVGHDAVGRGIGRLLYAELFDAIANAGVHTVVAGVALPNAASVALHERFGFRRVGVFRAVGRKFDRFWDVAWFQRPMP